MLTAKRAFNFMMDNGELDNAQLMDVARFSPTAQGQGSLLRISGHCLQIGSWPWSCPCPTSHPLDHLHAKGRFYSMRAIFSRKSSISLACSPILD
jgi:hypothetical protein